MSRYGAARLLDTNGFIYLPQELAKIYTAITTTVAQELRALDQRVERLDQSDPAAETQ